VPDVGAPGAGEVVFDVLLFPINPADVWFCRGTYRLKPTLPATPGFEGVGVVEASRAVARFIREEFREVAGVFLVVFGLVVAALLASALAWSGVGLIAFVPLFGIAVVPLQLAALVVRGFLFEYLGMTALGAYLTLYAGHARRRGAAVPVATGSPASARA